MNKFLDNSALVILWILVIILAPTVGSGIVAVFMAFDVSWAHTLPIGFLVCGILMGAGQWAILSTRLKKIWLWIPFTGIGFPVGFFLGSLAGVFVGEGFLIAVIAGAILGTILGVSQWSVLCKKVKNSIWWIPISILSWTVGVTFTLENQNLISFEQFGGDPIFQSGVVIGILLGISVGVMSGVSIVFLLRRTSAIATILPKLGSNYD
jgi:hypothetical protein